MSKKKNVTYVQWTGNNLEEVKRVLQHDDIVLGEEDELHIRVPTQDDGMVGYSVFKNSCILKTKSITDPFIIMNRYVFSFLVEEEIL
jgi:hypothetical protein